MGPLWRTRPYPTGTGTLLSGEVRAYDTLVEMQGADAVLMQTACREYPKDTCGPLP